MQSFFEGNDLFHDSQSGFRPGRSTELSALDMRERLLRVKDAGGSTALELLDLSAAFDTFDYQILEDRMKHLFGCSGTVLRWITSSFTDRTHQVQMNSCSSPNEPLLYGVPQGSALSPLLFNCYMRPLADIIAIHKLACQIYADDTQILADADNGPNMHLQLRNGLLHIQKWMADNKLGLNEAKTEGGDVGGPSINHQFSLGLANLILPYPNAGKTGQEPWHHL